MMWYDPGSTMLGCIPYMPTKGTTAPLPGNPAAASAIHPCGGPSAGASLALYFAGKIFGATGDILQDRLRYALGQTLVTSLGIGAVFLLGAEPVPFREDRPHERALWAVKPATLVYNTLRRTRCTGSQYPCLVCAWRIATASERPMAAWRAGRRAWGAQSSQLQLAGHGPFSSCFSGVRTARRPPAARDRVAGGVALGLALLLLLWVCLQYRLNYVAIFRYALGEYSSVGANYHFGRRTSGSWRRWADS